MTEPLIWLIKLWDYLFTHIFYGRVSMIITLILLTISVYVFIRHKMLIVSFFLLTFAFIIAYGGGFLMLLGGICKI